MRNLLSAMIICMGILFGACSDNDGDCNCMCDSGVGSADMGSSKDGKGLLDTSRDTAASEDITPQKDTAPQTDALTPKDTAPPQDTVSPKGNVGDPCSTSSDCKKFLGYPAICMTKSSGGSSNWSWQGGYCTFGCNYKNPNCPPGSKCSNYGTYLYITGDRCVRPCGDNSDCRPTYKCNLGECYPTTIAP